MELIILYYINTRQSVSFQRIKYLH